jgi:ubiquinone/menaquinone biosynthesis C-methylase UbiE
MPPRKKQAKEGKAKEEGYSEKEYWEKRYQEKAGYHEWYCTFENLKPLFEEIILKNDSVLEIGCGDSPLLTGLLSSGHSGELHGIDYSDTIIAKVIDDQVKSSQLIKTIVYKEMDARSLSYEDDTWDSVIDKGTTDAILCDKINGLTKANEIMNEACRVLKKERGTLIFISHIQVDTVEFDDWMQNCVLKALDEHRSFLWKIEAHLGSSHSESPDSPTVYVITSRPRKFTRTSMLSSSVEMSVLDHADSDQESDED